MISREDWCQLDSKMRSCWRGQNLDHIVSRGGVSDICLNHWGNWNSCLLMLLHVASQGVSSYKACGANWANKVGFASGLIQNHFCVLLTHLWFFTLYFPLWGLLFESSRFLDHLAVRQSFCLTAGNQGTVPLVDVAGQDCLRFGRVGAIGAPEGPCCVVVFQVVG